MPDPCDMYRFKDSVPPRFIEYDGYTRTQTPNGRIKILFIVESPPNPKPDELQNLPYIFNPNYFKREKVGLLHVLDPTNPNLNIRTTEEKRKLLEFAKSSGYYLLDAAR